MKQAEWLVSTHSALTPVDPKRSVPPYHKIREWWEGLRCGSHCLCPKQGPMGLYRCRPGDLQKFAAHLINAGMELGNSGKLFSEASSEPGSTTVTGTSAGGSGAGTSTSAAGACCLDSRSRTWATCSLR
ncbi:UNVERIFIED_CONTAM: hypothetical protein FKN15_061245 [Acipenser sinensis]